MISVMFTCATYMIHATASCRILIASHARFTYHDRVDCGVNLGAPRTHTFNMQCSGLLLLLLLGLALPATPLHASDRVLSQASPPAAAAAAAKTTTTSRAAVPGACIAPRDASKASPGPFCYVPPTVSRQVQEYLRTASAGAALQDTRPATVAAQRAGMTAFFAGLSKTVKLSDYLVDQRNVTLAGVPSVISTPVDIRRGRGGGNSSRSSVNSSVLFWLHGGGYLFGSCYGHQVQTVAGVAKAGGLTIVCPEYRLAPEHPFPAGLDDAVAAYKALIKLYPPIRVSVVGDSAGGGLAMALLLRLKKEGVPLPAAVGLLSPFTDILGTGDSTKIMAGIDPVLAGNLTPLADAYVGGNTTQLRNPLVSPLYGNYSTAAVGDLPPILIQAGLREVLLSDSVNLYRQLRRAGQPATLDVWEGMFHVFPLWAYLPEAQEAATGMGTFLRARLQG